MASIPVTADSAVFHYDFGVGIRATTQFSITYEYIGSTDDPYLVEPSLTLDDGATYTEIENSTFTLAQGVRKFSIRIRINNDPTIKSDYKVRLKVKPIDNLAYFTSTDWMETSVEFNNAGNVSIVDVDFSVNTVVDEGAYGVCHYTLTPSSTLPGIVQVDVTPTQALGTDIDGLQFSVDGVSWIDLPANRQARVPSMTSDFYIRFAVVLDNLMLEEDTVSIKLTELTDPKVFYGLPVSKTFTIVDKTILPEGTFINWYCNGYDKVGRYSDGLGGFTTAIIKERSPECGYVAAPYGTVLSTYCANHNYYEKVADGNDGYFIRLKTQNVPGEPGVGCGYVVPAANAQTDLTPTTLDVFDGAIVSNGSLGFASLRRDGVRSKYGALWGKWYWETTISIPFEGYKPISIGVATAAHPMGSWIGSDPQSWAWWPFDGTKYHSDVQTILSHPVKDKDVISTLLDMDNHTVEMWVNGVSLGILYSGLADEKIYAVANATNDSYALFNFGQYEFSYTPPAGYFHGFGLVANPPPERGTVLSTYCDGYDQKKQVADGKYGYTVETIKVNATECGYNPIPAEGTVLGYYCEGTTRYKRVADGLGGEVIVQVELNSTSCGYVPPPVPALIPTVLDTAWKAGSTTFSADTLSADMQGAVRSVKNVYSGKWYWEVQVHDTDVIVGITNNVNVSNAGAILGSRVGTFGWDIANNQLVINDDTTIAFNHSVQAEDIIGFSLDLVNQRLKFSLNGVWIEDALIENIPILGTEVYHTSASSNTANPATLPSVTFHFGDNDLIYEEPVAHVPGFGDTTTVYTRKGAHHSYYCVGLDRWRRFHDGGGGTYSVLYQTNSTLCGWKPPDPAGQLKSTYCAGLDKWGKFADGNYGLYDELIESPSIDCGYKPEGYLLSSYCDGYTRIGVYSDGLAPQGSYEQIIAENSRDCGYNDGGGEDWTGTGGSTIDPNLPPTFADGLKIIINPIPPMSDGLVIEDELP